MSILFALLLFFNAQANQIFKRATQLMGCGFEVTVVAKDQPTADKYISIAIEEIQRIENLISSWDSNSQTSAINKNAGVKPVKVDKELIALIERSIAISKLTDGAYDITYASMDKIWKFDGSITTMPLEEKIKASVAKVGYQNIVIDKESSTVFLQNKGMKIGFGGIGKGYAADKAKQLLVSKGVTAGIINASGDMNTWGKKPDGKPWEVAIVNPLDKKKAFGLLPIQNKSVVTSGNYEKFILIDGERYTHIINPKTGYPAKGILSVTVFAPQAELADALATALFVMGVEVAINRIEQLEGVECIIVDADGKLHQSRNIKINSN